MISKVEMDMQLFYANRLEYLLSTVCNIPRISFRFQLKL